MMNSTVTFSNYTSGLNAFSSFSEVCLKYGKKIIAIGGKKSTESIKEKLLSSIEDSEIKILDFLLYGHDCTYENMDKLVEISKKSNPEIILGIGGGKAIDTAKGVAEKLHLPIITIPTIASTCAAITSLSVVYANDGNFDSFYFFKTPPVHSFIDIETISKAPLKYLRAGIGDTIAKHYECTLASRNDVLNHSSAMAVEISKMCMKPLLQYGEKALNDANENIATFEVEQVILNNIISTGMVSMLIEEKYNGAIAHSLFYGLTLLDHIEKNYLHGDVVAYGVLVQLALDNNLEELKKLYTFFNNIGTPTSLKDINVENNFNYLDKVLQETVDGPDMEHLPYKVTKEMIFEAIQIVENFN